jgi:GTP-binding protein
LIIATKSDKLSNNELRKNIATIERALNIDRVLVYSANTRRGQNEIWGAIEKSLKS